MSDISEFRKSYKAQHLADIIERDELELNDPYNPRITSLNIKIQNEEDRTNKKQKNLR